MRSGDFDAAWRLSDLALARRSSGASEWNRPRHLQQIWTGAPLSNQRVLVRCYHGLGDTIQFVRLLEPLRREAREVIVWAQPELLLLIRTARGVDRTLPLHDGAPGIVYDRDIEIMELPHALRVNLETLPRTVPYLHPPKAEWKMPAVPAQLRVGLVWRGGNWDRRRSVPLEMMARLAGISGVELFSLQHDAQPHELAVLGATDLTGSGITELAARMLALDLVISIDTMAAHLSGALARPTWTMLHADCDWRWMTGRRDTPWYPTMHLFRQPRPGDWGAVVDEIADALAKIVRAVTPPGVDHTTHPAETSRESVDVRNLCLSARV